MQKISNFTNFPRSPPNFSQTVPSPIRGGWGAHGRMQGRMRGCFLTGVCDVAGRLTLPRMQNVSVQNCKQNWQCNRHSPWSMKNVLPTIISGSAPEGGPSQILLYLHSNSGEAVSFAKTGARTKSGWMSTSPSYRRRWHIDAYAVGHLWLGGIMSLLRTH